MALSKFIQLLAVKSIAGKVIPFKFMAYLEFYLLLSSSYSLERNFLFFVAACYLLHKKTSILKSVNMSLELLIVAKYLLFSSVVNRQKKMELEPYRQ